MSENKSITPRVTVENLVVNPKTRREIAIGNIESFQKITNDISNISSILWNEEGITLITTDYSTIVTFRPELNPSVSMFFTRSERRESTSLFGKQTGMRVWEGDFEPVKFTKGNLLKFLQQYTIKDKSGLMNSIKEMKIVERHTQTETMIDLDDENYKTEEERTLQTNIPTKFILEVTLMENPYEKVHVSLEFEAKVVENNDPFSTEKRKKYIQLQCVNARQVLRDVIQEYVKRLPPNIPKYYGRLSLEPTERRN